MPLDGRELLALERALHRISAFGEGGDRNYLGLDRDYLEGYYRPGELRSDDPFLRASGSRPQALDYVRHVLQDLGLGAPLGDGPVPITGVAPSAASAENRGATHLYPLGGEACLAPWFDAAAKHLAALGPAPKRTPRPDVAALAPIAPIARFYHTLVNAKPFEQINNSLLMGQVNVLLVRHGFAPVSHAWLDHLAFRTTGEQFAAVFAAHVEGRVKAPSDYGLEIPS